MECVDSIFQLCCQCQSYNCRTLGLLWCNNFQEQFLSQVKTKKYKSKEKKTKKERDKSEKRSKKKDTQEGKQEEAEVSSRNREEYEETNGTVSQEPERTKPLPFVRLLAEDSVLRMVSKDKLMKELLEVFVQEVLRSHICHPLFICCIYVFLPADTAILLTFLLWEMRINV